MKNRSQIRFLRLNATIEKLNPPVHCNRAKLTSNGTGIAYWMDDCSSSDAETSSDTDLDADFERSDWGLWYSDGSESSTTEPEDTLSSNETSDSEDEQRYLVRTKSNLVNRQFELFTRGN